MDIAWKKSMKFTSGTGVVYKPNVLVEQDVSRAAELASEITIGSVCSLMTVLVFSYTGKGCSCAFLCRLHARWWTCCIQRLGLDFGVNTA